MHKMLIPFIIFGIQILGIIKVVYTFIEPLAEYNDSIFKFLIELNVLGIFSIIILILSIFMKKKNQYWILPMLISFLILVILAIGYCIIIYNNFI